MFYLQQLRDSAIFDSLATGIMIRGQNSSQTPVSRIVVQLLIHRDVYGQLESDDVASRTPREYRILRSVTYYAQTANLWRLLRVQRPTHLVLVPARTMLPRDVTATALRVDISDISTNWQSLAISWGHR